jgi:hypothetical protein
MDIRRAEAAAAARPRGSVNQTLRNRRQFYAYFTTLTVANKRYL